VKNILQPDKLFNDEAKKDLKIGDLFEYCPNAI
jgi:hypothetical protein